ncbi:MAG TPA: ureidoglycolate lyase [Rhodanobacteraceae bacterium]|nr:ureidoglycolate lyase [Rhodanobacteraceae bacterium]
MSANDCLVLTTAPLGATAFAPYGDVIEARGTVDPINQGMGGRSRDLARVDVTADQGRAAISVITCQPEPLPLRLRLMERHPLGSQAFVPLNGQRYVVVVAPAGAPPARDELRAFLCRGDQGINYHRGIWHHPMLALGHECQFAEFHRAGPGNNCDEVALPCAVVVQLDPTEGG